MSDPFASIKACLPPTPLVLAYGALAVLSSQYWIYHEHCLPSQVKEGNIYDMGHKWLPNLGRLNHVFDLIPLIPLGYFMLTGGWKDWKSYLWVFSFIMLIRSLTTTVTVLPPCDTNNHDEIRTRGKFLALGGTHDYIFSGHTAVMILSILFLLQKQHGKNSWFWWLYAVFGSLFIISSHNHYTVDVILGWTIAYMSYKYFYAGCMGK